MFKNQLMKVGAGWLENTAGLSVPVASVVEEISPGI